MNTDNLKYFKKRLVQMLNDTNGKMDNNIEKFADTPNNTPDPIDRASLNEEHFYTVNKLNRKSTNQRKIMRSLHKIEKGNYGICERCGDDISFERLKAQPVTSYCFACKTEMEKEEKLINA
jgi:DnaK suppressor protein